MPSCEHESKESRVEIVIDCSEHDPAFCMFAGFRHIPGIAASFAGYRDLVATFERSDDPTVAVAALVEDAAAKTRRTDMELERPAFDAYPGYVRILCQEGVDIEIYSPADGTLCLRLTPTVGRSIVARKVAQHVYNAYEGENASAALAMATMDQVQTSSR